jgi:hypothetical protein
LSDKEEEKQKETRKEESQRKKNREKPNTACTVTQRHTNKRDPSQQQTWTEAKVEFLSGQDERHGDHLAHTEKVEVVQTVDQVVDGALELLGVSRLEDDVEGRGLTWGER